jgi:multidrug resistance efflux pump
MREAKAVLEAARIERQRRSGLLGRGAISRVEFDVVDREYNVARARSDVSRERATPVVDATSPEDIKRARAEVDRAAAQLAEATSPSSSWAIAAACSCEWTLTKTM